MNLPAASLDRVLLRVDSIWGRDGEPHQLLFGKSGAGKTWLAKALLGRRNERVLIVDPKPNHDDIWDGPDGDPCYWGRPVETIGPMFGYEGEPGGGPNGMWYRITGSSDRVDTGRRFDKALGTVIAEGHTVILLDDAKETCRQLRLAERVDTLMNLGRSASICAIISTTDTSWVAGRGQGGIIWVGHTGGNLDAAKAGAALLGWRGRERQDICAAVEPHEWIFSESQPGNAGPCITRGLRGFNGPPPPADRVNLRGNLPDRFSCFGWSGTVRLA